MTVCLQNTVHLQGLQYAEIVKKGVESDSFVSNSLMNMYAKHGAFLEAKKVSNHLLLRDSASWNPLIGGYLEHGFCQEALSCFEGMPGATVDAVTLNVDRYLWDL